jgi:hypothetical protein
MYLNANQFSHRPDISSGFAVVTLRYFAASLALILPTVIGTSRPVFAQAPGPELFAKEPRSALELWDAIDYLLRTDQAKKALPYLDRFMKSKPDDATLIAIRNRYGPGSILRLSDDVLTRPFAKPLSEAIVVAARKYAMQPDRIAHFVAALTKTATEQEYAVRRLREAGPYAVPFLVDALSKPELLADQRQTILNHIGRLDHSAVPPLTAVLESPNPELTADAATALGMIGDKRAIPFLTAKAISASTSPAVRTSAQSAISRLTGRLIEADEEVAVQVLTDTAWRLHRHQIDLGGDPVVVWEWDKARKVPVPREVSTSEAEAILGLRFANQALRHSPRDRSAQVVALSLTIEKAIERAGFTTFLEQDQATFAAAKAAGSSLLGEVLKTAIGDGKTELAAIAASALGHVIDRNALVTTGHRHPLVNALYATGRRLQFAAAKAIVKLSPTESFPGASQVVPTLARFLPNQVLPRAVVIDANPNRGSQLAGFLIDLGYDSELEGTGTQGFIAVAQSADVELILISFDLFGQGWSLRDTLANLKADSRTAAIPIFIYGPLNEQLRRPNLKRDYPAIRFLVQPVDSATLKRQFRELPLALGEGDRARYAREATELLAQIAKVQNGPLVADLSVAEPALTAALSRVQTGQTATIALGNLPNSDAQRSLANLILDPSRPTALRRQSSTELVHSIQRFGPLITASQEARLARILREDVDPKLHNDLESVIQALHPAKTRPAAAQPTEVPIPTIKQK